jgi:hypothetical protein
LFYSQFSPIIFVFFASQNFLGEIQINVASVDGVIFFL